MGRSKKIFEVEFPTPPIEGNDRVKFFFASVSAIYTVFTPEQIGCAKHRLWTLGAAKGETVLCKYCVVRAHTLTLGNGKQQAK